MTRAKTRIAAAVGIGVIAGFAAAALIPSAESTPTSLPFAAPTHPLTSAPARKGELGPQTDATIYLRARRATMREEVRKADPAGGPDWVLRVYEADRMIPKRSRRPGSDGVASVGLCAQLGREVGGEFGWIDGDDVFRPVSTRSTTALPSLCTSRLIGPNRRIRHQRATLVDSPTSTDPSVRGSVVWGLTGRHTASARLDAAGHRRDLHPSDKWGGFVEFFGPSRTSVNARLRVTYAGGKTTDSAAPPKGRAARRRPPLDRDSIRVIARAPDPGGGPSWGLSGIRTKSGHWCTLGAGYAVDGFVGEIDPKLGTLREFSPDEMPMGCDPAAEPTRKWPVQYQTGGGTFMDIPTLDPGRDTLRLQHGRTVLYGRTMPGVDSITVQTPRDVRTFEPTGPGRAFIAVYDGNFGPGQGRMLIRFKNGHTEDQPLNLGMPWW